MEQYGGLRDVWALSAGDPMNGRRCDVQLYLDFNTQRTQVGFDPAYQGSSLGHFV